MAAEESKGGDKGASWTCSLRVHARPCDVYAAFVDPRDIMRYTRARAECKQEVGGVYSVFDGSIHGEFVELEKDKKIVMKWRFRTWAEGVASTVTIALSEAGEGVTDVAFSQTGIPAEDAHGNRGVVKTTRDGWKSRIFMGIKQMLGYGLEITSESS